MVEVAVDTDAERHFSAGRSSDGVGAFVASAALLTFFVERVAMQLRESVPGNARQTVESVCVLTD